MEFWTTCVGMPRRLMPPFDAMREDSNQIDYATFREKVGPSLDEWARSYGYDEDLTLESDWHVGYFTSYWRGQRVCYLRWSAIEMIFVGSGFGADRHGREEGEQ